MHALIIAPNAPSNEALRNQRLAAHRGRVCLIGDGAHACSPSAGKVASLALEDARMLARGLGDEPTPELPPLLKVGASAMRDQYAYRIDRSDDAEVRA